MAEVTARQRPPQAIFRASASAAVGGGHVVRCLALADELAVRGWRCRFAAGPETAATVPEAAQRYEMPVLDESDPTAEPAAVAAIAAAAGTPADLLVVDHYGRGDGFERAVRPAARVVMALDDPPARRHEVDLLLDQNGGRTAADYRGLVPAGCRVLAGPRYALLRRGFADAPAAVRRRRAGIGRLFVAMGATDPHDLTGQALDVVRRLLPATEVDVMLAGAAPHLAAVPRRAATDPYVRLHVDAADVSGLMAGADLAIGTAGINLWERCAQGLGSLIVVAAENQRANADHVVGLGGGMSVGEGGAVDRERLRAALNELAARPDEMAAMAAAARRVCDGRGASRVADAVEARVFG